MPFAGANDPQSYLAAIGNQDFVKQSSFPACWVSFGSKPISPSF
jgi:hypothetical protein